MKVRDFILTGTQVYGVADSKSDIDIVLKAKEAAELEKELEDKGFKIFRTEVQKRMEYSGFYFELGVITFNIICVFDDEHLSMWQYATEEMRKLPPFTNREERVKTFQSFVKEKKEAKCRNHSRISLPPLK